MKKIFIFLSVVVMELILIALGFWQWQRLHWKRQLIENIQRGQSVAPSGYSETPFRSVRLTGHFLPSIAAVVSTPAHAQWHYALFVPFAFKEKNALEKYIWVRVQVAQKRKDLKLLHVTQISGTLRPSASLLFVPAYSHDLWTKPVIEKMNAHYHVRAESLWLDMTNESVPIPENNHLQYMVTWWALAVILGVIYFLYCL